MTASYFQSDAIVLVVDDDPLCRELCRDRLEHWGLRTVLASTGGEALRVFRSVQVDVVLLDVLLPDMDGVAVAAEIRRLSIDSYVPVVLCTGMDDAKTLARGLERGASDFLTKPINFGILRARLEASLRTRHAFQQIKRQNDRLQVMTSIDDVEQDLTQRIMQGVLHQDCLAEPWLNFLSWPQAIFNGDLVMAARTPSGRTRVMIADSTGHGLAAAVAAVPIAELFRSSVASGRPLWSFLALTNEKFATYLPTEMFLVLCVVEFDPQAGTALVWNGGAPDVVVCGVDGQVRATVPSTNFPLGVLRKMGPNSDPVEVRMQPGDRVFLYSDGVPEAVDVDDCELGDERLLGLLRQRAAGDRSWEELHQSLECHVVGSERRDDMTLIEIDWDGVRQQSKQASRGEEGLRVAFDLSSRLLKQDDFFEPIRALLATFPADPEQRDEILLVTRELLANAIDHGLLELDSELRDDETGYDAFYVEREDALARLREGNVRLEFVLSADDSEWRLVVEVEDTGRGFDVAARLAATESRGGVAATHGNGIEIVRTTCRRLEYLGRGNIARATYSWPRTGRISMGLLAAG